MSTAEYILTLSTPSAHTKSYNAAHPVKITTMLHTISKQTEISVGSVISICGGTNDIWTNDGWSGIQEKKMDQNISPHS